jgi:AcrR family transcriptional regulator
MANRTYRMSKRAESLDATRERIVAAAMALHGEQGVVTTTHTEIAARAGVGPATVYRHFPTLGSLVVACGAQVQDAIRPPAAEDAPRLFAGFVTRRERLERLVAELDGFYERGARFIAAADRDRDRVPELDVFARQRDADIEALVGEAVGPDAPESTTRLVVALTAFPVWTSLKRLGAPPAEFRRVWLRLLACAIAAAARGTDSPDIPGA